MDTVDLVYPVVGTSIPTDHSYPLLGALCRLLPCLHDGSVSFGLAPITGVYVGQGTLRVEPGRSHLRLRLAAVDLPKVLALAGKSLELCGRRVCVGVPQVRALRSAPALHARTVTIKNATEPETLRDAARRELDRLGVGGHLTVPIGRSRNGLTEPRRHVLRIKDRQVICFSLLVEDLSAEESLKLQTVGLGGRRHLGGGIFLPVANERDDR